MNTLRGLKVNTLRGLKVNTLRSLKVKTFSIKLYRAFLYNFNCKNYIGDFVQHLRMIQISPGHWFSLTHDQTHKPN